MLHPQHCSGTDDSIADRKLVEGNLRDIAREKDKISERKFQLYEDYRSGNLTRDAFKIESDGLSVELRKLEQRALDLEKSLEMYKASEAADQHQDKWEKLALLSEYDADQLRDVIKEIIVHGEKDIEIVWNTNDFFVPEELR